jgi:hypothetical protein
MFNPALIVATTIMMNQTSKRVKEQDDDVKFQAIREELMDDDWDGSEDELNREAESIFKERYGYEY